jgi:hypothetical protein
MIDDPAAVLDEYLRHRIEREAQVLRIVGESGTDGATPETVVAQLYADVPEDLHPVARYTVWAHLRKLSAEGLASSPEPDDIEAPWSSSR